jgi:tRNA 2-thiouridine synthesizing protein A
MAGAGGSAVAGKEGTNMAMEIAQTVDAKGLSCPMPIVKTAQAIKGLVTGQLLEVLATDPGSVMDFTAWSKTTGNVIVEQSADGGVYRFVLRKK